VCASCVSACVFLCVCVYVCGWVECVSLCCCVHTLKRGCLALLFVVTLLTSSALERWSSAFSSVSSYLRPQKESGDVRALLNKFNRQAEAVDASTRRDSGPAKTPTPALRTRVQPGTAPAAIPENERLRPKLMPMATPQHRELASMPRPEPRGHPGALRLPPVGGGFPRPPAPTTFSPRMLDTGRVRLAEELLQNVMLKHVPGTPAQALMPASRGNIEEVTPLRRPLPPEARQPLKPRRPQQVNLEPYLRSHHPPALPLLKKNMGKLLPLH